MIYSLRRGSNTPTVNDLHLYELGWETTGKKLYINDDAGIKRINTIVKLNGLFNNDPEFYAPTYVMANRVLKSKASWTIGSDPFEYVSIDDTVTEDSTNLIISGAVSSALTTLQSTINEALNNKSEIGHIHEIDDVTNLRTELDEKLPASLDTPIAELENQTLREVFEGGQLLLNNTFTLDSNSDGLADNWNKRGTTTATILDGKQVITNTSDLDYIYILQGLNSISGNKYYARIGYISSMASTVAGSLQLQFGGVNKTIPKNTVNTNLSFQINAINISQYAIILTVTNGLTNSNIIVGDVYLYNQTALGISSLTVERMDYWFSVFKTLKDIELIQGKVFISSTDPGIPPRADSLWFHI